MKLPAYNPHWPDSWKSSHFFDLLELHSNNIWHPYTAAYRQRQNTTYKLIKESVPLGSVLLDVAAAQGNFRLLFAERGYKVVWNDFRSELEDYVRLKYEHGDIKYRPGNILDMGFSSAFDAILITEVIEHVAHPDMFLAHIAEMLKPGGIIVMSTPNGAHLLNRLPRFSDCPDPSLFEQDQFKPDGDGHIFLLWPDEVRSMASRAGLIMESHNVFTTPWINGRHRSSALMSRLPKSLIDFVEGKADQLPTVLKERLMIHSATRFRRKSI
jgi:2-polyprenyl-6-hydroxyphenyl methylase/3-demethylubiquinone-9 3-methyltransferase